MQPEALPELEASLRQAEATAARVIQDTFTKAVTAAPERLAADGAGLSPADLLEQAGLPPFRAAADKYRQAAEDAMRYRTGIGEAVRGSGVEAAAAEKNLLELPRSRQPTKS